MSYLRLNTKTFTANGTWVCPAGVTFCFVTGWGGGGGGGGGALGVDLRADFIAADRRAGAGQDHGPGILVAGLHGQFLGGQPRRRGEKLG